jgi:hypothetical protein
MYLLPIALAVSAIVWWRATGRTAPPAAVQALQVPR